MLPLWCFFQDFFGVKFDIFEARVIGGGVQATRGFLSENMLVAIWNLIDQFMLTFIIVN